LASPIDLNSTSDRSLFSMPAEITMHAIAFGSAISFIGSVLVKLL